MTSLRLLTLRARLLYATALYELACRIPRVPFEVILVFDAACTELRNQIRRQRLRVVK